MPALDPAVRETGQRLAGTARIAYERGWALGTSGNFSAVVGREPLRLLITPSGVDKGALSPDEMVMVDGDGRPTGGADPSAETSLHLAIVRARGAGAVSHTHSVWGTLLSDAAAGAGGLSLEGYEMLKGLSGVRTHEHREWLPVVENTQDWTAAAPRVETLLRTQREAHGFLIRRHGLYTWGGDLREARRHMEILEFLLEVAGRSRLAGRPSEEGGEPWRS